MARADRHLVKCAGCGHNFETELYGEVRCPYCKAKVWIEPPEGYVPPSEDVAKKHEHEATGNFFDTAEQTPPFPGEHGLIGIETDEKKPEEETETLTPDMAEKQRMEDLHRLLESTFRSHRQDPVHPPSRGKVRGGWLTRFTSTIKSVLSGPSLFFDSLPDSGYGRAFLFGWIVCTIGIAFFCLYGLWQIDMNYDANLEMLKANAELSKMGISPEHALDSIKQLLGISLVAAPVLGALNLLFSALLNHLGILLVSGRNRRLRTTLRATAYGFAPLLMMGVPVIGNLLGGIWAIVLQVIALSRVYDLSTSRASLAVLLPLFGALMLLMAVIA